MAASPSFVVQTADQRAFAVGAGSPAFTIRVRSQADWQRVRGLDLYRTALAFLRGDLEIDGDLVAAADVFSERQCPGSPSGLLWTMLARLRIERLIQSRATARANVEFHYDRSNEFYRAFLDRRMVYSCAYFEQDDRTLDQAQEAKLDHVCRKLDLSAADSFLDVGCGWGALVAWAAERYGARALGCTLSTRQHELAARMLGERGLAGRAGVALVDYRDVRGRFTKIASIGMVEHVGRTRLAGYFRALASMLEDSGLLLNHGIVRPAGVKDDAVTRLLQRRVFPGGELARLDATIAAAERAGFEVLDVENLRPHYARTCRAWVERLQANRRECLAVVDAETYRTWLLYLAGSAASFARGTTDVYQLLLAKRKRAQLRPLTRRYMYP